MTDQTNTDSAPESGAQSVPATGARPAAPARSSSLEEFSQILHALDKKDDDDTADGDESQADGGEPKSKPKKPKSLEDVAQALRLEAKSLYDVEIPSSRAGEKPYTLGQLKDLAKERDDFAVASLKLDEDRRTLEREKVNAEAEVRDMLAALPAEALKPEAVKKVRDAIERKRAQARAQIVEAIPEWTDPTVRESELKSIVEHLQGYGIPASFLLANLDAGIVRMVRDAQRLDLKVRKALATVQERRGKPIGTSKKGDARGKAESRKAPAGRVQGEVAAFRNAFSDRAKH